MTDKERKEYNEKYYKEHEKEIKEHLKKYPVKEHIKKHRKETNIKIGDICFDHGNLMYNLILITNIDEYTYLGMRENLHSVIGLSKNLTKVDEIPEFENILDKFMKIAKDNKKFDDLHG